MCEKQSKRQKEEEKKRKERWWSRTREYDRFEKRDEGGRDRSREKAD